MRAFLHTIWWRRDDLYSYSSHFDSSGHLYGNSNATMTCTSKSTHHSSSTYICQTKMGHEQRVVAIRAFLHTIWWRRVDHNSYSSASSTHLYDCTNATMTCTSKSTHHSSSTYVCQTKMGHEQRVVAIRAFLHTIWLRRVDLNSSHFATSTHLYDCTNATMTCTSKSTHHSLSTYVCQTKMGHEQRVVAIRAFLHTIWLRNASHPNCRLHMYAKRNLFVINEFEVLLGFTT